MRRINRITVLSQQAQLSLTLKIRLSGDRSSQARAKASLLVRVAKHYLHHAIFLKRRTRVPEVRHECNTRNSIRSRRLGLKQLDIVSGPRVGRKGHRGRRACLSTPSGKQNHWLHLSLSWQPLRKCLRMPGPREVNLDRVLTLLFKLLVVAGQDSLVQGQ